MADRGPGGYDVDWFGAPLAAKGIKPSIPGRQLRNKPIKYDKPCYIPRQRCKVGLRASYRHLVGSPISTLQELIDNDGRLCGVLAFALYINNMTIAVAMTKGAAGRFGCLPADH